MSEMTPEAIARMERMFDLRRKAIELLHIIAIEFKNDPMLVRCFDLRVVEDVMRVAKEASGLEDLW